MPGVVWASTFPDPSVVRSTVVSCIATSAPSEVSCRSPASMAWHPIAAAPS